MGLRPVPQSAARPRCQPPLGRARTGTCPLPLVLSQLGPYLPPGARDEVTHVPLETEHKVNKTLDFRRGRALPFGPGSLTWWASHVLSAHGGGVPVTRALCQPWTHTQGSLCWPRAWAQGRQLQSVLLRCSPPGTGTELAALSIPSSPLWRGIISGMCEVLA